MTALQIKHEVLRMVLDIDNLEQLKELKELLKTKTEEQPEPITMKQFKGSISKEMAKKVLRETEKSREEWDT